MSPNRAKKTTKFKKNVDKVVDTNSDASLNKKELDPLLSSQSRYHLRSTTSSSSLNVDDLIPGSVSIDSHLSSHPQNPKSATMVPPIPAATMDAPSINVEAGNESTKAQASSHGSLGSWEYQKKEENAKNATSGQLPPSTTVQDLADQEVAGGATKTVQPVVDNPYTTILPPMPPPPTTTVGGSPPPAAAFQQVRGSSPSSVERMNAAAAGGGGGSPFPGRLSVDTVEDSFEKSVNDNPNDEVDSHGGSDDSKKLVTIEDATKSLDYQATSPKSHEPKSFADIFKDAENIRTKGKLRFIPPVFTEIGTKHANIPDELLVKQNEKWLLTLVGSFVGKRPAFPFVKFHAFRLWKKYGLVDVILNDRGFFYFKFDNDLGMQKVLEMRPWLFNDIPVLLKKWEVGIEFDRIRPTSIHLWVNFYDLTPVMWDYEILSHIVSVLGVPISVDRYTEEMCEKNSGRAAFARVLLRVNADQDLPSFVEARVMGQMKKFRVQYLWKPDRCSHCNVFGHTFIACSDRPKSAEEMEATIPSTTTSNVAGPSGTKQVPIDSIIEQDFIQPKRRKRRPKKAQHVGGIVIPKPKVKYVPKVTADPKGKGIQTQPETTGSSDSSLPAMVHHAESSTPQIQVNRDIPETSNQFDALCDVSENCDQSVYVAQVNAEDDDHSSSLPTRFVDPTIDKLNSKNIWSYRDPEGKIHGPFSLLQLHKWTDSFPFSIKIWSISGTEKESILLHSALLRSGFDIHKLGETEKDSNVG